uniref:Uncharacterized protein n=1 Tax=Chlorobium chlorochromatii (strain CaD3) TaxID=340177 RepID=Q3AS88_CHLCH
MQKASTLYEIDAAVDRYTPVSADSPFYVDFKNLRGFFQEQRIMRLLNVRKNTNGNYEFQYDPHRAEKTFLFIAGMRGSGKTSELSKYTKLLNTPDCFFVVVCNIDSTLDMDRVQYMDILIFQLEKLFQRAEAVNLKLDNSIVESMNKWFQDRVKEINSKYGGYGEAEIEIESDAALSPTSLIKRFLGLTARLKMGLSGSREYAETIRTTFQNNFIDFATKFNTFIEQTNEQLRKEKKAKEILFIIDGLEKTMSADTRKRIILEESNRIKQIKVTTLFTLPIELMKEEAHIRQFSEVITFPFVKVTERDGSPVAEAIVLFKEFIYKRVDASLFDSEETVKKIIRYSGGSPRQLLRIIQRANLYASEEYGKITDENVEQAINELGNQYARFIEPDDFEQLKELKVQLDACAPIGFNSNIQSLLEHEILFEYNDGTYKSVNPLLERSTLYKFYVLGKAS